MLSDQAHGLDTNKKVHSGVDCQTVTKYITTFFANPNEHFVNLCNNSDQTLFFNELTFARSHGSCCKKRPLTSVFNISLGTWQALMHGKTCLIPILM